MRTWTRDTPALELNFTLGDFAAIKQKGAADGAESGAGVWKPGRKQAVADEITGGGRDTM